MRFWKICIAIGLSAGWLAGCSWSTPTPALAPLETAETPAIAKQPEETSAPVVEAIPAEAYPPPTKDPNQPPEVTPFNFDKPLLAGAEEVSGVGRPGVPILIIDITFMGGLLGQGTIDDAGKFAIKVSTLEKGHRIGIALGILEGTGFNEKEFRHRGYYGDLALVVPQVGFFFDTAQVKEK